MKRFALILFVLLGAVGLSACSASAQSVSWPGLSADANNAYLAKGQFVYAVRLSDGAKVWQYPASGGSQIFDANPVLTPDGQLLAASAGSDHGIYSIDPATGKDKWSAPFTGAADRWIASPLVVQDAIYAPNNDGSLYVLKLSTGEKLWSLVIDRELWGTPATDGKLIFVPSLDHFLYAVDPQAQKIAWKVDLGGAAVGSPAVSADGKSVYIGSSAKKLFAIDTTNGSIQWTADTADWVWNAPAISGDTLFASDISGNLYSIGAVNGKNAWPVVQPDGPITGSPLAIQNGVAVATESGFVYAFDQHGAPLWNISVGGNIYTSPVASGNLILVAPLNADFMLAGVSNDGKQILWKFTGK